MLISSVKFYQRKYLLWREHNTGALKQRSYQLRSNYIATKFLKSHMCDQRPVLQPPRMAAGTRHAEVQNSYISLGAFMCKGKESKTRHLRIRVLFRPSGQVRSVHWKQTCLLAFCGNVYYCKEESSGSLMRAYPSQIKSADSPLPKK